MDYYHGSRAWLNIGSLMEARPLRYYYDVSGMDEIEIDIIRTLENLLEETRPVTSIPRLRAVFLVKARNWNEAAEQIDYAGGYIQHLYKIQPLSKPEPGDLAWYSEAQLALDDNNRVLAETYAKNYWSGIPFVPSDRSLYEYRVTLACVKAAYYGYA